MDMEPMLAALLSRPFLAQGSLFAEFFGLGQGELDGTAVPSIEDLGCLSYLVVAWVRLRGLILLLRLAW